MRSHRRRWAGILLGAVLTAALAVPGAGTAHAESNGGVRMMPLGDSITDGITVPGAYRTGLWRRFADGDYRVDFVGSLSGGPAELGDHDHEGHSGWRIDQIDAGVVGWLRATTPHTVLLHIGTNDILQNHDPAGAPARLSALIDHITATAPAAEVFVATIIPIAWSAQEAAVRTYNAAIPEIVRSKVSAGGHVHLVDMHAALTSADLADGVHPNATGYDRMAAAWYTALRSVPGSIGEPGGGTDPGTRACDATYSVVGQWSGGFQASVKVTAGSAPITGWTVTWRYAGGQSVTQAWNATITSSGSEVTARNAGFNGPLGTGASTEFGFLGTWTGANEIPALTCTAS